MSDFLKANFDKLLLVLIIVYFSLLALHAYHHLDAKLGEQYNDSSKLFAGALLTLITGGRLMQRRVDTEGGGTDVDGKPLPKRVTTTNSSTDQNMQSPASRSTDSQPDAPMPVTVENTEPVAVDVVEPKKRKKP